MLHTFLKEIRSQLVNPADTASRLPPIPINDTSRTFAAREYQLTNALQATAQSGHWLNGPRAREFAESFARYCGTRFCLPVANGTDALEIALRALLSTQHQHEGEVVTVANAGGYTTTAAILLGLTPVYADITEASQLVDPQAVIVALSEQTRAVVATHLYGGVVDVGALRSAMDRAGYSHVPIVEDCAQAHGGRVGNKRVGALGAVATFSFYPTKNLGALGDAGAIVTSDETLFELCRSLHQYGWTQKYVCGVSGGRNSRMDELQAATLSVLLSDLDHSNERRRQVLAMYRKASGRRVRFVECKGDSVNHLAVALCEERDTLRQFLGTRRIATDVHYPVLDPDQPAWKNGTYRIGPAGLDVSRRSVARLLTVPCFPLLTDGETGQICDALSAWERA